MLSLTVVRFLMDLGDIVKQNGQPITSVYLDFYGFEAAPEGLENFLTVLGAMDLYQHKSQTGVGNNVQTTKGFVRPTRKTGTRK